MKKSSSQNNKKVMVIGFDGCSFDMINPLIHQGKLPNFASLIKGGVYGKLRSTIPPLSGPAWATFQTGKNPGKHGIFDFFRNTHENYTFTPINRTFLSAETLWDIISRQGKRVGVMNALFCYPPKEVNGFIISGKETPGEDKSYTYPPSLKSEILSFEPNYKIEPFDQVSHNRRFLRHIVDSLNMQEKVNRYLLEKNPCDFSMTFFAIPDVINHVFWSHIDPAHPNHSPKKAKLFLPLIDKCYQTLDAIVGERMRMLDEDTTLIIMSDHGAGPLHKTIQLNKWLRDHGLFVLNEKLSHQRRVNPAVMLNHAVRFLINALTKIDRFGFRRKLSLKTRQWRKSTASARLIEWSKTKAYAGRTGEYGIHINLKGRQSSGIVDPNGEYETIRTFIISNLSKVTDPQTGEKIFRRIYRREEVYQGESVTHAPDLILDFGDAPYLPGDGLLAGELLEKVPGHGLSGMHRDHGIFIATGGRLQKGKEIEGINMCDLAPTILYMMGLNIDREMDGKVLVDIFETAFREEQPLNYEDGGSEHTDDSDKELVYTGEENESVKKKLESLGYL